MKKFIGTTAAFAIGIVSIFAFKAPTRTNLKDSKIRWSYNGNPRVPANCVQVTCTKTNTLTACGVGDQIYSVNDCSATETVYIFHP